MKTDNAALAKVIESCFDLGLDGRVPKGQRGQYITLGKRLRGTLINLLTAEFKDNTPAVEAANRQIRAVNKKLKEETNKLDEIADRIEALGELVSTLDGLIGLAAKFV